MQSLSEQLIRARGTRRKRLIERAASDPDVLPNLLERIKSLVHSSPGEALDVAGIGVEIAVIRTDPRNEAAAWRAKAQALRAHGRHAEAITAFDAATAAAKNADDELLAAQVQIGRIDSLCWLGRNEEAISLGQRLAAELDALKATSDEARVHFNLGNVYFRMDRYHQALASYEKARELMAISANARDEANMLMSCANILTQINQIEEALAQFRKAREIYNDLSMASTVAMVDANMGWLYYLSGEYSTALAAFNRARQEFAGRRQELETAKCDADLADVYREVNLYPEALSCYDRSIDVFGKISLDYERARAELGRASVLMALSRHEEALASLDRADSVFRQQKNVVQGAHVKLMRAYLMRAVEEDSLEVNEQARAAFRTFARLGLKSSAAEAQFLLADVALSQGEDATRRMRAVGREARSLAKGWLESRAESALGSFYLRQSKISMALSHFRTAVAALETARTLVAPEEVHVSYFRDKLSVYEKLIGTLLRRGRTQDVAEAFEYVERSKSRLLLERVQSVLDGRMTAGRGVPAQMQDRLMALRSELSRTYHRMHSADPEASRGVGAAVEQNYDVLLSLEQEYRTALRDIDLVDARTGLFSQSSVIPVEKLREALECDEALIEYYVVDGDVCAFALSHRGLQFHRNLAPSSEISELARRFRYHLQKVGISQGYQGAHDRQLQAGIQRVLAQLYTLLVQPMESALKAEKLVLVPYGPLHGLPFHAFFDGARHALDRWEIVYAPSASVWHAGVREKHHEADRDRNRMLRQALVMGVPSPGIHNVLNEVEQLEDLLPNARIFCGESATVEAFRSHAAECSLIHLATHALFRADNPLFSGLQFSDGWLFARDLYEMILDCDLATLSACRTGVSTVEPGDELFGLMRGFLSAGARSLAVSFWPTDDAATAAMMSHFYQFLTRGGSKAAALRMAQQELRQRSAHPYHWAAFAMVGER